MENNELLDKILLLQGDNKISFMDIDGLHSIDITDFYNQPLDSNLYSLNRDRAALYSMAYEGKNKRWVNDLAMVYFIEYLSERIEKQRQENISIKSENELLNKKIDELTKANEYLMTNNIDLNLYISELKDDIDKNENTITTKINKQPTNTMQINSNSDLNLNISELKDDIDKNENNITTKINKQPVHTIPINSSEKSTSIFNPVPGAITI